MMWYDIGDKLIEVHSEIHLAEKFGWTLEYIRGLNMEDRVNIDAYFAGQSNAIIERQQNG